MSLNNNINSQRISLFLATITSILSFFGSLNAMRPGPAQPVPIGSVKCRERQRDIFADMQLNRQLEIERQAQALAKEQRRLVKDETAAQETLVHMQKKFAQLTLTQPALASTVSRVTFIEPYNRGEKKQEDIQKERTIIGNIAAQKKRTQLKCAALRQERLQCMKPGLIKPSQLTRTQTPCSRKDRHQQEFWAEKTTNPLLMCLTRKQMNVLMSDTQVEDLDLPKIVISPSPAADENV